MTEARLKEIETYWAEECTANLYITKELVAEVKRLRAGLEFYAKGDNWLACENPEENRWSEGPAFDRGEHARKVLEGK